MIAWRYAPFPALSGREVYELLALRQRIFVVEQRAAYQDADGLDLDATHLLGVEDGQLVAALRVLAPGVAYAAHTLGRVVVAKEARGRGIGRELVRQGLVHLFADTGGPVPTALGAQAHLEGLYGSVGFARTPQVPYFEDGILHVHMRRPAAAAP